MSSTCISEATVLKHVSDATAVPFRLLRQLPVHSNQAQRPYPSHRPCRTALPLISPSLLDAGLLFVLLASSASLPLRVSGRADSAAWTPQSQICAWLHASYGLHLERGLPGHVSVHLCIVCVLHSTHLQTGCQPHEDRGLAQSTAHCLAHSRTSLHVGGSVH